MEIILLKDIDNLGDKYDIVTVKNGFGRNYLIPQKMAVIANDANRAKRDQIVDKWEAEQAARLGEFQALANSLSDKVLNIAAKAGTSGKIFGSVTGLQISQALKEQFDIDIDRKLINLPEEVKNLGSYTATAKLHKEVEAKINFEVVAD